MSPKQSYKADIERLLIDTKKRLNDAADRGNVPEVSRLAEQVSSLSRLLEVASEG